MYGMSRIWRATEARPRVSAYLKPTSNALTLNPESSSGLGDEKPARYLNTLAWAVVPVVPVATASPLGDMDRPVPKSPMSCWPHQVSEMNE